MREKIKGLSLNEGLNAVIIVGLIGLFLGFFAIFNDEFATAADKLPQSIANNTAASFTGAGYQVPSASSPGFSNFVVTQARNGTNGAVITTGNYTYDSNTGIVRNATAINWPVVHLSYTFDLASSAENISLGVNTELQNQTDILGLVLLAVFFGIAITALLVSFLVRTSRRKV